MKKFNLLIPIAGKGSRFPIETYIAPKPLILLDNKTIIEWTLGCIDQSECNIIFIIRKEHADEFCIDSFLRNKFGNDIKIVITNQITEGSVCSCLLADSLINNDLPLVIHNSDIYFEKHFTFSQLDPNIDGHILTFKSNSTNYSYSELNDDGNVVRTAEKNVISNNASVGLYHFKSGKLFVKYAKKMIEEKIKTNNEYYICPLYNILIQDGLKIRTLEVDKMHVFGTPEEYNFFINNSLLSLTNKKNNIAICADHSGFELKEKCKQIFLENKIEFIDFGIYDNRDCDYVEYVRRATDSINKKICNFGFGFCRSGQGVNICANKIPGIRSALVIDGYFAEYAIRHNCCNFFSISSKYVNDSTLKEVIQSWKLNTFDGGRHQTRIQKMERC
jgi:RpiB/LacA/LacB family sugar-phosphate isomerase